MNVLLLVVGAVVMGAGGYYMGAKYGTAALKAELAKLLAEAKTEEAAIVAKIKALLAKI